MVIDHSAMDDFMDANIMTVQAKLTNNPTIT
jgi:hypothetical protein